MRTREASGFELTFLIFAIALLAVPISDYVVTILGSPPDLAQFFGRFLPFVIGALILSGVPRLRTWAIAELSRTIPKKRQLEVALVALTKIVVLFASIGAFVLFAWTTGGADGVIQYLKSDPAEVAIAKAYSTAGLLTAILLAVFVGPVVEELAFRGLLYQAWERQWGAFVAAMLSSLVFASYHPHEIAAFTSAILFVCLVRRTGTLRASIFVHALSNLMLWYPVLGPYLLPAADKPSGELSAWSFHLACLAFAAAAIPAYAWLAARKPYAVSPRD